MVGVRGYVGPQFFDFVYTVYIIRLVVKQKIEVPERNYETENKEARKWQKIR